MKKYSLIALLAILALLVLLALGVFPLNLALAKGLLSGVVRENLGLELTIRGPVRLRFGTTLKLTSAGIDLALPGDPGQPFLHVDELDVSAGLRQLLEGNVHLRKVAVSGLVFDYCQDWSAYSEPAPHGEPEVDPDTVLPSIAVQRASVQGVELRCSEQQERLDFLPHISSLKLSAALGMPMELVLNGQLAGQPFDLVAEGDELNRLLLGPEHFPLTLNAQLPNASLTIDGTLTNPLDNFGIDALITSTAKDLAALMETFGLESPPLGALELTSTLHASQQQLAVSQASITLESLSVLVDARLSLLPDCPQLNATLSSDQVDLNFFDRFLAGPGTLGGALGQSTLEARSCGDTLTAHLDSLQIFSAVQNAGLVYEGVALPVEFRTIKLDVAQRAPGKLEFDSIAWGEPLSVSMNFGSIEDMLSGSSFPLQLAAAGAGSSLDIDAFVAQVGGQLDLSGHLEFDSPHVGALHSWVGVLPDNTLTARVRTEFKLGESSLTLPDFSARVGQSDIRGALALVFVDEEPVVTARARSDHVDLEELGGIFPPPEPDAGQTSGGQVDHKQLTDIEWVEQWLAFPDIDFDYKATSVAGFGVDSRQLSLAGRVSDRLIQGARVKLEHRGIQIAGKLDAVFRSDPWTVQYSMSASNFDIGTVLENLDLVSGVVAHAERAELQFDSHGLSLHQLVENGEIQTRLENLSWIHHVNPDAAANTLEMSWVELTAAPGKDTRWSGVGNYEGVELELLMSSPPLGQILRKDAELPLELRIAAGKEVTIVNTVINRRSTELMDLVIDLSAEDMVDGDFVLADLHTPLPGFALHTRLRVQENGLEVSDIKARIGTSVIEGAVEVERKDKVLAFAIKLESTFTETDDFVELLASIRKADSADANVDVDDSAENAEGFLKILNREMDALTEDNTFNVTLSIDELRSAGQLLGKTEFGLVLDQNKTQVKPLRVEIPDGMIDVEYLTQRVSGGVEASFEAKVENLDYGGLLRLLDDDSEADGKLSLDVSLASSAQDWDELVSKGSGTLDMVVFPENVEAGFLDLWASNLIVALMATQEESGKKMNCMVVRFEMEDGVMTSENTFLDTTDIIVRGRGTIDLGEQQLDMLAVPQAKLERFFSVSAPIKISGPFDDFDVEVAPGGFFMTMTRWYYGLIYVPWKRLTGETFPEDGIATCYNAMEWELPDESL